MNLSRQQKIELLKMRAKGQPIDPADWYRPSGVFLKVGNQFFNDGYQWSQPEFEAFQQKTNRVSWIPALWFIEIGEDEALGIWLVNNSKPFAQMVPGTEEDCSRAFIAKMNELSDQDGIIYL